MLVTSLSTHIPAKSAGDLKADGSVALTADWDVGAFEIRAETFQSDVATGTAPLIVASTTLVTNLNVERLNSLQSTAFVLVDGSQAFSADQSMGGNKLTSVGTPSASTDAATKGYVDSAVGGLDWKASVRAASTAGITLASDVENGDTLDGVTLATGDRILLKNQGTASENGVYVVAASGAPARASDLDTGDAAAGVVVLVEEGSTNADTAWLCTSNDAADVVGTNDLAFTAFGVGTTDHGALSGLADDDHTQYATADGTRWTTTNTANRLPISDGSGNLVVSSVTDTEAGYLSGVTSAIQTQLNGKAASSHNHAASDITSGTLAHERGGIEADISTIAIGDVIAGSGTGTAALVTATGHVRHSKLTIQSSGAADWEAPTAYEETDGATVTFNVGNGLDQFVVLDGNRTLALNTTAINAMPNGTKFTIKLTQDGVTGSRTVTWFSGISWAGGSAPTLTTTAGKSDRFIFVKTGTGAYEGHIVGQNI